MYIYLKAHIYKHKPTYICKHERQKCSFKKQYLKKLNKKIYLRYIHTRTR